MRPFATATSAVSVLSLSADALPVQRRTPPKPAVTLRPRHDPGGLPCLFRAGLLLALALILAILALLAGNSRSIELASAHQSGCHSAHSCPSDRATYRWRGHLCVSARNRSSYSSRFDTRRRYGGLTYYCTS